MNIEVEIKLKIDDISKFKELIKGKSTFIKSKHQVDEYFTAHDEDFLAPKKPTKWFRIRQENKDTELHFHQTVYGDVKHSKEYETGIKDYEMIKKILEKLNFKTIVIVNKKREFYETDDLIIMIDEVKNLGTFVEVEAKNGFKTIKDARDACIDFIDNLNIEYELIDDNRGYAMMLR